MLLRTSISPFLVRFSFSLASFSIKSLVFTYFSCSLRYRLVCFSFLSASSICAFVAPVFLRREIVSILPLIRRRRMIIAIAGKIFFIISLVDKYKPA